MRYDNGDNDNEQRVEATIDATESRWSSYYAWGWHPAHCVRFRQWPTFGLRYMCKMVWLDAGHSGNGEMEDGGPLDVPSFHSLLFASLLLSILPQYKWGQHGFLPPAEISPVEVEFPHVQDPLKGGPERYKFFMRHKGSYVCIRCTVVWLFPFLSYSCTGLYSPGGLHLQRGIMSWHNCMWGVQGQLIPTLYILGLPQTLDI